MIRLPAQLAAMLTGLWAVGIAYTSQLHGLPGWAPYAIAGGGVIAAGLGVNVPQTPALIDSTPPPASPPPAAAKPEGVIE